MTQTRDAFGATAKAAPGPPGGCTNHLFDHDMKIVCSTEAGRRGSATALDEDSLRELVEACERLALRPFDPEQRAWVVRSARSLLPGDGGGPESHRLERARERADLFLRELDPLLEGSVSGAERRRLTRTLVRLASAGVEEEAPGAAGGRREEGAALGPAK